VRTRHVKFLIPSVVMLALVAFPGLPFVASDASSVTPTISNFTVTPSALSSGGGDVYVTAHTGGVSSCVLSVNPPLAGFPKNIKCANQLLGWPVIVLPQNSSSQPVTYQFALTASPLFGGTGSSTAGPLSVTVAPPGANVYVALGDSYAAGEGNPGPPNEPWVDHDGNPAPSNGCDRSAVGYPMLVKKWLDGDRSFPTMNLQFLACSGATTGDLWASDATAHGLKGPSTLAPQQLLDTGDLANARVITVTIGGNDLNFADILSRCDFVLHRTVCSARSRDPWIAKLKTHIDALGAVLYNTYTAIKSEASLNTPLFVVGYPDIFPTKPNGACVRRTGISVAGMTYLALLQGRLTSVMEAAANKAHANFVNPNLPSGAHSFIGHSVCAQDSYLNGAVPTNEQYSFHPNAQGQQALASDVEAVISSTVVKPTTPTWSSVDSAIGPLSVTCPTVSFCAASDPQGNVALYDGTSWSAPSYVDTTGANMNSVSCAASSHSEFCAGVDVQGNIVTYNGTTWSQPSSIESNGNGLMRVSCTTVTFCVVVDADGTAFVFNGSGWSSQIADQSGALLWAVNCPAVTYCAAFDLAGNVVTYNGSSWSAPVSVDPSGGIVGGTISCPSSSFCAISDSLGNVATFNGTSWGAAHLVDSNRLTSVACTSASFCVAIDIAGNVLTYNGTTWSQPKPMTTSAGVLWSVACPSMTFCIAGGDNGVFSYK